MKSKNIEIVECKTNDIPDYFKFINKIYRGNPHYKNSLYPILKSFLYEKSIFCKYADIKPLFVKQDDKIVLVSTIIIAHEMSEVMQLTFFEALPDIDEAVTFLIEYVKERAQEKNIKNIVIGLNGHVNYGLGFLANQYDEDASFGNNYNPPYYLDYFDKSDIKQHTLTSFRRDIKSFNFGREQNIIDRLNLRYTVRTANFKNLKSEIEIYSDINNQAFLDHPLYFKRTLEEDYDLFRDFQLLLDEENLLILEKDNQPIGFMLWYPDFNELIAPGKSVGLSTLIKYRVLKKRIKKVKFVELGVIPKYQNTGAVLLLFKKSYEIIKDRFQMCEAGWIIESNNSSTGFGKRWCGSDFKKYVFYEINL